MPKPKLLLDENIGIYAAQKLRGKKYNIASVLESKPGSKDETVLAWALRDKRILVTLDKDFGQLVHLRLRKHTGVILLRLNDESPKNILKILNLVLKQPANLLKNKFIVATETKIRLR